MGKIKEPSNLSPRIKWLRDFYFQGVGRNWNNEFRPFTTGTRWDRNYNEITYYVVPETYAFFKTFNQSCLQGAVTIPTPPDFYDKTIAERQAWFVKKAMTEYVPQEILPGDLLCGAVFNLAASQCLLAKTRPLTTRYLVDNNKVSDHHAIIPTDEPADLSYLKP